MDAALTELLTDQNLLSPKQRIEQWLYEVNGSPWCDGDDCEIEESTLNAYKNAARLGLSAFSRISRKNGMTVTVSHIVFDRVAKCPHLDKCEKKQLVGQAIKDSKINTEGRATNGKILPEIYYDVHLHCWWHKNPDGKYISLSTDMTANLLNVAGLSPKIEADGIPSQIAQHLVQITQNKCIDVAQAVSGYRCGVHKFSGKQVLVTSTYELIQPQPGEWPIIRAILIGLLGEVQFATFNYWAKIFYESLKGGYDQPGQMLILAGPPDCGKSFIQDIILTSVFGGRGVKAFNYASDSTNFNQDIFEAEHLIFDDEKPNRLFSQQAFMEKLKGMIAGKEQSCHGKNKKAFTLRPRWRISMSLNDDDDSLKCLPAISGSFKDKLMLFQCGKFTFPMPNSTASEKRNLEVVIRKELPAFVDYLETLTIPKEVVSNRFGVESYLNTELVLKAFELSEEGRLLVLIDTVLFKHARINKWHGRAEDLHNKLVNDLSYGTSASKLLKWDNAAGTLLGRLATQCDRVRQPPREGESRSRVWDIQAPANRAANGPLDEDEV